jgi:hypothetical protein
MRVGRTKHSIYYSPHYVDRKTNRNPEAQLEVLTMIMNEIGTSIKALGLFYRCTGDNEVEGFKAKRRLSVRCRA